VECHPVAGGIMKDDRTEVQRLLAVGKRIAARRRLTAEEKALTEAMKARVEAEEEEVARKILGVESHQAEEKTRRGRPSGVKGKPLRQVLVEIEGRPLNELSAEQRKLAYRIGVKLRQKGRTQEEVTIIIRAVLDAKSKGHPLTLWPAGLKTSAFEVAGSRHNLSAEAVESIWKRYNKQNKQAKLY